MNLDEAKEYVRVHGLTGKTIHASADGGIYIDTDVAALQASGVNVFQVFPETTPSEITAVESTEKKSKKSE